MNSDDITVNERLYTKHKSQLLDRIKDIQLQSSPHLVILGAGASSAATPEGEKNRRKLPLMKDLADALELKDLLNRKSYKRSKRDFETFFDDLVSRGQPDIVEKIEQRTFEFFNTFDIARTVTLYDKLVLSLRAKDTIVSFNWDPLLPYAYRRNGFLKPLPSLWFMHGNVKTGYCPEDNIIGWSDDVCRKCGKSFIQLPLLYPVSNKNYDSNPVLSESWMHFEEELLNSYFITIFGYRATKTDRVARKRFIKHLKQNSILGLLQIKIIDPNAKTLLSTNYSGIDRSLHLTCLKEFSQSWLTRHPRLTCEALYQATMMLDPNEQPAEPRGIRCHAGPDPASSLDL